MILHDNVDQYRFERKFQVEALSRPAVEMLVRTSPALFRERFPQRWVNNIYLDTWSRESYRANLDGRGCGRMKVRIRWYGDLASASLSPKLELKIKHGQVNCKRLFQLPSFLLDEVESTPQLGELFARAGLPPSLREQLGNLEPALINRYRRKYFVSADKPLRITVDSDLRFYPAKCDIGVNGGGVFDTQLVILELKYAPQLDALASHVSQHFPFRLTRSSKYVMGIEYLCQRAQFTGLESADSINGHRQSIWNQIDVRWPVERSVHESVNTNGASVTPPMPTR